MKFVSGLKTLEMPVMSVGLLPVTPKAEYLFQIRVQREFSMIGNVHAVLAVNIDLYASHFRQKFAPAFLAQVQLGKINTNLD